jgi:hypothetical protein
LDSSDCREIVKVNNQYTKYADALVDYYVKKGNGKSNLIVTQSRALKSEKTGEYDEERERAENVNSFFKIKNYVKDAYNFRELEEITSDDSYEFERKIRREANGAEYEYIEIIPNAERSEMLNAGYLIIDTKTKCILEYKIYTSEKHLKNAKLRNLLILKLRINKILSWSKFKEINNQYILVYNKQELDIYVTSRDRHDVSMHFISDLFIYAYKNNVEIPDESYDKRSIFEAGTKYSEEFWLKYNVFPLSVDDAAFLNSLLKK